MATKKFPYAVIYGGKLIPANTPIEVKKAEKPKNEDKKPENEDKKPE